MPQVTQDNWLSTAYKQTTVDFQILQRSADFFSHLKVFAEFCRYFRDSLAKIMRWRVNSGDHDYGLQDAWHKRRWTNCLF